MKSSHKEIYDRISKLQTSLQQNSIDAVIILQKIDMFYFSGTLQQGVLFIPLEGEPLLFVKKDTDRAKKESPLKYIYTFKSFNDIPHILHQHSYNPEKIGLELDIVPYNLYKRYTETFSKSQFFDFSTQIRRIRMIKSEFEIEKIKMSGELIEKTYKEFKKCIRLGMKEIDAACELEYIARKNGHMGLVRMRAFNQEMFYGHLLSGKSGLLTSYVDSPTAGEGQGAYFSQGAGNKVLKENEPFSVDFVFNYEGYLVDMTRIFFLGEPPKEYQQVYNVAKKIHQDIVAKARPGITCDTIYSEVLNIVAKHRLEEIFMGPKGKTVSYIGHGVGLELDELPVLAKGVKETIEENTVFALEPKFFIPEMGIAGIENTYLMTQNGLLLLTKYSDDIQIIV